MHLYSIGVGDTLVLDILILEVYAHPIPRGDDEATECEGKQCYHRSAKHIGLQESLETHATAEDCYDFAVLRKPRGDIDDGNEDKERAEEIGIVRDKVSVVVPDDCTERYLGLEEFV